MSVEPATGTLEDLIDELARVFHEPGASHELVLRAGFDPMHVPVFDVPEVFWARVVRVAADGRTMGGVAALVEQAVTSFPGNETLAGYRSQPPAALRSTPQRSVSPVGVIDKERATIGQQTKVLFVSYSRGDEELVGPIVQVLKASGLKVFIDVDDIKPGDDWQAQINAAIRESERFFLFWSSASQRSEHVRREWKLGLETEGCTVVPILLDETPLPEDLARFRGTTVLAPLLRTMRVREARQRRLWRRTYPLGAISLVAMATMFCQVMSITPASEKIVILVRGFTLAFAFAMALLFMPVAVVSWVINRPLRNEYKRIADVLDVPLGRV